MGSYSGVSDVLARMQHVVEFSDAPLRGVDQRGIFGNTPLKVAAGWGDLEAVGLLLDAGADVNARNEDGDTALHWAAANDDHAVAILLVERGASLVERNDDGMTPVEIARSRGNAALVALLTPPD